MRRRTPALAGEANAPLERLVDALESKARLDLDRVQTAVRRLRDPAGVADRLVDALHYSQRVEADVAGMGVDALLPHGTDDLDARFLEVWVPEELGHGVAQGLLLERLGVDPLPTHPSGRAARLYDLTASAWRRSAVAYELLSLAYHTIGAINERLALAAYTRMAEVLQGLGEHELVAALFAPMRRDEAQHLGYYRAYARQLAPRLRPWQRTAVRCLVIGTYAPVGARRPADQAVLGAALLALDDDPDHPAVAGAVAEIAEELLGGRGRPLPPFVADSMRRCVDAARRDRRARPNATPALVPPMTVALSR